LYTAENPSLAMLEALAHVTMLHQSRPYCLATLEIPNDVVALDESILLLDWNAPLPPEWMKKIGDDFVADGLHLALKVPSVLLPGQYNYLINPMHSQSKQVNLVSSRPISFDQRLVNLT
jgi:RES domain-containing protein